MSTSKQPIYFKTKETKDYIDCLLSDVRSAVGKDSDILLNYPAIYVHVWRSKYDEMNGTWSIYIGETNDMIQRTKEHWAAARIPKNKRTKGNWQFHMLEDVDINDKPVVPTVYFFGHEFFHKSMTLDIENRLIDYCYAMPTAHIYNGRTNPQGSYSGDDKADAIFSMIWRILRNDNSELFLSESSIQKSAIYKASPNHRLTADQKAAKSLIIDRTIEAMLSGEKGQLVFVEGDAGTGKTVLTSSTFYDVLENDLLKDMDFKCCMLINHEEQKLVYKNMARKLGYEEEIIQNPTGFLKSHSIVDVGLNAYVPDENNIVDLVFVDEAHLLWDKRNQAYDTKFKSPQLDEIVARSRVTVIMLDENQMLHKGHFHVQGYLNKWRDIAKKQGPDPAKGENNYIQLNNQLRMNCSESTLLWLDQFTKDLVVEPLILNNKNRDSAGYEIRVYDDPFELHRSIKDVAATQGNQLSRVVATCDWDYKNTSAPVYPEHYWNIRIGNWSIPWNEEIFWRDLYYSLNKREKKTYSMLDWAEKDYSIYEAGSTFTIQGFDLDYSGVILGPSVRYDKNHKRIWFDEKYRKQDYMKGNRTLDDGSVINVTDMISQNELRVLLTRGSKGLFIYACDPDLRAALKDSVQAN